MKTLLRIKLHQLRHTITGAGRSKLLLFAGLGLFFVVVLGFFSLKVFGYLYRLQEFPAFFKLFLAEKMMLMVFLTFFSLLILSALIASLEVFFLSRDLQYLFATPLPSRSIFLGKTVEVFIISSAMVIFFCLPILFAYCRYFAPSFIQVIQIFLAFTFFTMCSSLTGMLFGLLIPSIFPVRRMQVILSVVSVALMCMVVVFIRLSSPERLLNPTEIREVFTFMGTLKVKGFVYFPFNWLAQAMTSVSEGKTGAYTVKLGMLFGLGLILLLAGLVLEKTRYLVLYDRIARQGGGRRRSLWHISDRAGGFRTLWQKEVKTFFRTPTQWSQLLVIAALLVIFVINLKMMPIPHESVKTLVALINIGLIAFMSAGLNSRFTLPAVPGEGPALVHIAASPFHRERFFLFKLVFYLVPQLAISAVLFISAILVLHFDTFTLIAGIFFLVPVVIFLTLLAIYFGLQIQELEPISPQHVVVSRRGISYMLWSMIYFVLCLVVFLLPLFIFYMMESSRHGMFPPAVVLWLGGFVLIHAAVIAFLYRRSRSIWLAREF